MGKLPSMYTDSEETENTESSVENLKKKKKPSILKYSAGNVKKKKCKIHTKSEPDDSDLQSRSGSRTSQKIRKLRGILKKDREKEERNRYYNNLSSDEESDSEPLKQNQSIHRYLVGRVPRPSGSKPGRGGGLAIIVKKNKMSTNSSLAAPQSPNSNTKKKSSKWLSRKRSY